IVTATAVLSMLAPLSIHYLNKNPAIIRRLTVNLNGLLRDLEVNCNPSRLSIIRIDVNVYGVTNGGRELLIDPLTRPSSAFPLRIAFKIDFHILKALASLKRNSRGKLTGIGGIGLLSVGQGNPIFL